MPEIYSSVACNVDVNLLQACLPLFDSEKVEAIEWSFDTLFAANRAPVWFVDLLNAYSYEGRLIGHGVFFSLFLGKWNLQQQDWLARLKTMTTEYTFDHITEHFGFMTGEDFHKGAPLSIPFTTSTLALGRDRLKRIQQACNCPVGLENLAFAYSLDEVKRHGDFLNQLLEPVNGFIILDLHNLYCQSQNFGIDNQTILSLYQLDRVREIHISGGSWTASKQNPEKQIRRDTHDDSVPDDVFALLKQAIPHCPNLKYVVLEQLGVGLTTPQNQHLFQEDFFKMDAIVQAKNRNNVQAKINSFLPESPLSISPSPVEDPLLHAQQVELSNILETATDFQQAQLNLHASSLANSNWEIEKWDPCMIETALAIAQKWKNGFE